MVSVNRVYEKVLALANKEQRGYITPQEFNLFADMAQMEIFEQYFYDLEQRQRGTGNQFDYADISENIQQKIYQFQITDASAGVMAEGKASLSPDVYRLGAVRVQYKGKNKVIAEEIQGHESIIFGTQTNSTTSATHIFPHYIRVGSNIQIHPHPDALVGDMVFVDYISKPQKPNWTYITVANRGSALYNPGADDHKDFSIHASEENKLVIKILQFAGVVLKDNTLLQAAASKEIMKEQQEKQ